MQSVFAAFESHTVSRCSRALRPPPSSLDSSSNAEIATTRQFEGLGSSALYSEAAQNQQGMIM